MSQAAPSSSSFRGWIGVAREDITPPVGIRARSWGAAKHEVAEGVHRPLTLICITFEAPQGHGHPLDLISADLMTWRSTADEWSVRGQVLADRASVDPSRLMFCLTHTHSAPSARRDEVDKLGGEFIEPYFEHLRRALRHSIRGAQAARQPATLTWRYGCCDLATNRDLPEPGGSRIVCGYNPAAPADDTLLVGRITNDAGGFMGTIVNYACHPTTLAWENRLLSPDFLGALREVVESHTGGAPCLFLQGASGELAPAEQYVADPAVADRHGRRLGYAVLSTLEAMNPPGMHLRYAGVVESGAPLAVWRQTEETPSTVLAAAMHVIELPLKPMPSTAEIEAQWRTCEDPVEKERLWRKLGVRRTVGDGETTRVPLWVWRLGDAILVGQMNETYSRFQGELRERFPGRAIAVINLVNGSAGYLPPREMYEKDVYQAWQSPFAAGALERLIEAADGAIREMIQ